MIDCSLIKELLDNIRKNHTRFDRETELQLIRQAKESNQEARTKLFYSMAPWCIKKATRFTPKSGYGQTIFGDVVNECLMAIDDAIARFDETLNCRLITLLGWRIINRLTKFMMLERMIRTPAYKYPKEKINTKGLPLGDDWHPACPTESSPKTTAFELIERAKDILTDQEYQVLVNSLTNAGIESIGRGLGVTKQRVSQVKKKAIHKLQRYYTEVEVLET